VSLSIPADDIITSTDPDAQEINLMHVQAGTILVSAWIMIGAKLAAKKAKVGHGCWESWVEENLRFTPRWARMYLRIYEGRDVLNRKSTSDLNSLEQAVRLLSDSREDNPQPELPAEPVEPEIIYKTDPKTAEQLKATVAALAKAEQAQHRAEIARRRADEQLADYKDQVEKLQQLKADKERVESSLAKIAELEKRQTDLFKDADSTKLIQQVLVRSREFFTRECMQIPALKLRPASIKVMQQDFEGLVELVENWLQAVKQRFLEVK